MIIPSLPATVPPETVFDHVDGILFTGSHSNIEPHHYAGPAALDDTKFDPQRDATTLPMIRSAVDRGIPILGICRGFQEMNVAYGGSLHQRVHELDGFNDHREPEGEPDSVQYGPAHGIEFSPHGQLTDLMGGDQQATVNSLHWQGIDRLAPGLGHLDFDDVFDGLGRADFDGWASIEILPKPDPDTAARKAAESVLPMIERYNKSRAQS